MKGLIYRDIQINKKNIVLAVLAMVLIFKTMKSSDFSGYEEQQLLLNIYTFMGVVLIYAIAEYVFKPDAVTKWQMFLYATPIEKKTIVGEKYLFDYIFLGIGAVLSTFMMIVYAAYDGGEISYRSFLGIINATVLILTNSAIHKVLVSLMGEKCANIFSVFLIVGFLVLFSMICVIVTTKTNSNLEFIINFLTGKLVVLLLMFSMILHGISYFTCVKMSHLHLK